MSFLSTSMCWLPHTQTQTHTVVDFEGAFVFKGNGKWCRSVCKSGLPLRWSPPEEAGPGRLRSLKRRLLSFSRSQMWMLGLPVYSEIPRLFSTINTRPQSPCGAGCQLVTLKNASVPPSPGNCWASKCSRSWLVSTEWWCGSAVHTHPTC